MPLPVLAIQGAIVGISAIGNLFSSASRASEMNKRITRTQELAAEGLISQAQIAQRLRSIDRLFNQRLTSVLNTTAIRSRGFANTGTIGAAAAGQVEGARLSASESVIGQAQDINVGVRRDIANLELGRGETDVAGALIAGGASGTSLAVEAGKSLGREDITSPVGGASEATGAQGPVPIEQAGSFNPFLRGTGTQRLGTSTGGQIPTQSPFGGQLDPGQFDFLPNVRRSIF